MKTSTFSIAAARTPSWMLSLTLGLLGAHAAMAQSGPIPTATVQAQTAAASYGLDGVIEPVKQSTVSAQASGRIATLSVKAGDKVRAGQVLATIDDRDAQASVQQSQAQINQAQAELRNAQAQWERTRDLQSKGFVSKAAMDTADAQYQSARAQHEQANAGARRASIAQSFTKVTAPFDGWVLQTFAQAGDLAVPGKPLVTVYAPQPLRAVVQVPASRAQAVRQAQQTQIVVLGEGAAQQAIVPSSRLEIPSSDPVSQTTEWRLELPAKDAAQLVPGQQVRAQFSLPQGGVSQQLLVPRSALVQRGELSAVYVAAGQGFALRAVRLGRDMGAAGVQVISGLKAGEVVALDSLRAATAGPSAKNSQ